MNTSTELCRTTGCYGSKSQHKNKSKVTFSKSCSALFSSLVFFYSFFPPISLGFFIFYCLFGVCGTLRKQVSGKVGQCEGEERDEKRGIQRVRVGEERGWRCRYVIQPAESLKRSKQNAAL